MNRSLSFATAALCGLTLLTGLSLSGCGGGTSSFVQSGGQVSFAGRSYSSTFALENGQTGVLSFSTSADNIATGTFTIDDGTSGATALQSRVVIATPLLSGTVDPATGAFDLSGAYTIAGQTVPISIQGVLPVPPSVTGGTVTATVQGQNYSSSFSASLPVPTPSPTPTPGATPSPSPTPTPNPGNSAFSFTLLSKSSDCNFNDSGLSNLRATSAVLAGGASAGLYNFTAKLEAGSSSFQLSWQRLNATNGLVPETFTFVPTPAIGPFGDEFQAVLASAVIIPIGQLSAGVWYPSGGTLVVESVVGKTVRVRGENVEFSPNRFNAIGAKGTFRANFSATFENVQGL